MHVVDDALEQCATFATGAGVRHPSLPALDTRDATNVVPREQQEGRHRDADGAHRPPWWAFEVQAHRPVGERTLATPGTLDYFLVERYALYTVTHSGRVIRGEIDHPRWELQPAEVRIERNTIASVHDLPLPGIEPVLHFSRRQPTHVWPPIPIPRERPLGVPVMEPTM